MQNATPTVIAVFALELAPAAAFGFAGERVTAAISEWPRLLRLVIPGLLALAYAVLALAHQTLGAPIDYTHACYSARCSRDWHSRQ